MSRLLLISRSRKFEARLRSLLGSDLRSIMGSSLARGASTALATLGTDDGPVIAVLGPSLSYAQTYELSAGLTARYPGTGILLVKERGPGVLKWMADMKFDAVASPSLDDAGLLEALRRLERQLHGIPATADDAEETVPTELERDAIEPAIALSEINVGAEVEEVVEVKDADVDVDVEDGTPPAADREPEVSEESSHEPVSIEHHPETHTQIIAVVSPKGGIGKTTAATNLAVGLAEVAPMSVVLIDADVQFGDVATALSLSPTYTLPNAVSDAAASDSMVLKTYLTAHPGGFFTVCGSSSPIAGDRVTGDQMSHLIAQLADEFRYIVIDTAPGLGEHALAAIEHATDVVMICDMSVMSARGLRSHLAVLNDIGIMPHARHVVLNFADRSSGLSIRDVEAITGVPIDVAIPRSAAVALSSNRGIPLLQEHSKKPAARAMAELVRRFDPTAAPKRGRLHRRAVVA